MRIAHVCAAFPPYMSGTGNNCFYIALEMARLGHQVSVHTAMYPPRPWEDPPELRINRLPAILRMGNAPLLPGLVRIRDVDLIHLHCPFIFGAEIVSATSKLRRIPYVVTYQNDLIGEGFRRLLFAAYLRATSGMVYGGAAKIAVVSHDHALASRISPYLRRRWEDVVEVPNGVDTDAFTPDRNGSAVRKRYGISDRDNLILFVGGLDRAHYFKGVSILLRAFASISQEHNRLMIVGEGDLRSGYQQEAQRLGVGRNTIFPGYIPINRLAEYYAAATFAVLPSVNTESFGMVLIEAMACGKTVIASDLPGVRTVVADNVEGLLVPPGDVDALSEKIKLLLRDPQKRKAMGIRGRRKVVSLYAWPKIVPRILRMYEEVLSHRSGPGGKNQTMPGGRLSSGAEED
jgi:glycosyltransferase involved in cell wall biosynthesis